MKRFDSNDIRSGQLACSFFIITSFLILLFCLCYIRTYAMQIGTEEQIIQEVNTAENTAAPSELEGASVVIDEEATALSGPEVEEEIEETVYDVPSSFVNPESGNTVSYNGGKTIERSSKITYGDAGEINDLASPDSDGFMKLDDRYLIAVGSRFDTEPGQYIDLVLENGVVIECMMGDLKADVDTDSTNTFTYKSSCCSEFIIDEDSIREDIYKRGNASIKNSAWDSPVVSVVVYDDYYDL